MTKSELIERLSLFGAATEICIEDDDGEPVVIRSILEEKAKHPSNDYVVLSGCQEPSWKKRNETLQKELCS